jgi:hypothetical protein
LRLNPTIAASLLAATLLPASARADEPELHVGDTLYYCDRNGSIFWSPKPCEEIGGKQLRRGVLAEPPPGSRPGTFKIEDPDAPAPDTAAEPTPLPAAADAEPADAAGDDTEPAAASGPAPTPAKTDILKQGQHSLLRLLGFGLVAGLLAKWRERSFLLWFFFGCILSVVLVALNLLPP